MDDIKQRRKALGWDRKTLGERAMVDVHIVQLVELGHYSDAETLERLRAALTAGEHGDNGVDHPAGMPPRTPDQGSGSGA